MRPYSTPMRTVAAVLMLLVMVTGACSGHSNNGTPEADASARVESLRSLPYVGFSTEKAAAGGVVRHDRTRAYPGVNLYTSRDLCRADLVDMDGRSLQTWRYSPCGSWSNAELLPDGDLVVPAVTARMGARPDNRELARNACLLRLGWDGHLVWRSAIAAHHDVELTPAGKLATLTGTWRVIPDYKARVEIEDHAIAVLGQDGTLLEQASLYDLLAANTVGFTLQDVAVTKAPGILGRLLGTGSIDLFHSNTVEWMSRPELAAKNSMYSLDNVIVTIRHQDTIAIIDWKLKKLVWAWGQGVLSGPHDGTVTDNGNILVFDNGLARGWSRVLEVDPIARKIVWEYKAARPSDFFSIARGACQRFPNGNTLITNSDHGQAFEVTPDGAIVWDFLNPLGDDHGRRATIHRMRRYDAGFIDGLMARSRSPGL